MREMDVTGAHLALLTHAPNDLTVLHSALAQLPQEFPPVTGINLQTLESEAQMALLLAHELAAACRVLSNWWAGRGSRAGI
jgi:cobaltochelatase CobN